MIFIYEFKFVSEVQSKVLTITACGKDFKIHIVWSWRARRFDRIPSIGVDQLSGERVADKRVKLNCKQRSQVHFLEFLFGDIMGRREEEKVREFRRSIGTIAVKPEKILNRQWRSEPWRRFKISARSIVRCRAADLPSRPAAKNCWPPARPAVPPWRPTRCTLAPLLADRLRTPVLVRRPPRPPPRTVWSCAACVQ